MKILTSIHFHKIAGITHYVLSLAEYIKMAHGNGDVELVGIDVVIRDRAGVSISGEKNWKLYSISVVSEKIGDLASSADNLKEFESLMAPVIREYEKVIEIEKPDIILLSGTYHLVWCLYVAARRYGAKKIAIHYHGIISKEVEKYKKKEKNIYCAMERSYLDHGLFYIFSSNFARETVEREVFLQSLKNYKIIPNPISLCFFKNRRRRDRHVKKYSLDRVGVKTIKTGFVMRWTYEKNPQFITRLAKLNLILGKKLIICAVASLNSRRRLCAALEDKMKFIAPMPDEELAQFYRDMDIIVCPSRFETYGNIAQESVACGTPALISRNMGVAEQFYRFGLGRLIVDFKNTKKIYDEIESASTFDISKKMRDELRINLGSDVIFKQLVALLRSL